MAAITPFQELYTFFDTSVISVLQNGTTNMIALISPLFAAGFGVYVMLIAFSYMRGENDEYILDFFYRMIGWGVVISLGLNASMYTEHVVPFINGLGEDLAGTVGTTFNSASALDVMVNKFLDAFINLYNGSTSIPELKLNDDDALTIINFLRVSHRYYSEQIYPEIIELINQMKQLNNHKEIKLVSVFFMDYFKEVTDHLDYENDIFYPYVRKLVNQIQNNKEIDINNDYSVIQYKDHHDDIEEKLNDLKNLLIKYLPINQDQIVRRKLLFLLSELEFDLKIHSDIEELILIPLTMRLEKKLKQTRQ